MTWRPGPQLRLDGAAEPAAWQLERATTLYGWWRCVACGRTARTSRGIVDVGSQTGLFGAVERRGDPRRPNPCPCARPTDSTLELNLPPPAVAPAALRRPKER